jgi:Fe(3+) dicitrate transport protein
MKNGRLYWLLLFCLATLTGYAQKGQVTGTVTADGEALSTATISLKGTTFFALCDNDGRFRLTDVPWGKYTIVVFALGKQTVEQPIILSQPSIDLHFTLQDLNQELDVVEIQAGQEKILGVTRLASVENFGLQEGKKTEVVLVSNLTANLATNNPRQLYGRVTGLNIWESDGVGLQLGIGGRGLNPNRTASFNTRQNGYDISADALGYPESYYTPPAEAIDRIEIIRGAASLQYGTQFGGMLNFRFKKGPIDKKIEVTSRQTLGSWNFFGSFNSVGGTVAAGKLNYYAYYQFKQGDGYRPNSDFDYHNAFASLNYQVTKKLQVNLDITHMNYLAQQPGGETDRMFAEDPKQSLRARNWFRVRWDLLALNATYALSPRTQLNIRNFGLLATRSSIGNMQRINQADDGENRTLIDGDFENIGNETRLLHHYTLLGRSHVFLGGVRFYSGHSTAVQGDGNDGAEPDFYFLNPDNVENSDYRFKNLNYAAFVENIFVLTDRLSVTPGIRVENIQTFSNGYYRTILRNQAGTVVSDVRQDEDLDRNRSFVIAGIGLSYRPSEVLEAYANLSQNYRAINFSDLRIQNPNFYVDPNIHDEKGYTADMGIRGAAGQVFTYELSVFQVAYKDRIGQMLATDAVGRDIRRRGNIADARILGVESFGEVNISALLPRKPAVTWTVFVNTSVIDARYIHTDDNTIRENNKVEMVPPFMLRTGTTAKWKSLTASLQFSYTGKHYSDASNAESTAGAIEGIIPAYQVMDLSLSYGWKMLTLQASCNNLLDEQYFTRRAESYPGPGIIPADGRGIYVTLQARIGR